MSVPITNLGPPLKRDTGGAKSLQAICPDVPIIEDPPFLGHRESKLTLNDCNLLLALADYVTAATSRDAAIARERVRQGAAAIREAGRQDREARTSFVRASDAAYLRHVLDDRRCGCGHKTARECSELPPKHCYLWSEQA